MNLSIHDVVQKLHHVSMMRLKRCLLAVALVCKLHNDTWMEMLGKQDYMPISKLAGVVQKVQHL